MSDDDVESAKRRRCQDDSQSPDVIALLDDEISSDSSHGENVYGDATLERNLLRRVDSGPWQFINECISSGVRPRALLQQLTRRADIPDDVDDLTVWHIIVDLLTEPPPRKKLPSLNTIDDVARLINTSSRIVVLTGAGVSVSCGIPDFRSRNGIYARLSKDFPDLPNPQAMFDINFFFRNPQPFFKFANEIFPGKFQPSPSHKFIRAIELKQKLLRNYAQNIDTLEVVAGITKVVLCHGSFASATCQSCGFKTDSKAIEPDIMAQKIPRCHNCPTDDQRAILKPDIVFFGESLSDEFHRYIEADRSCCDLLLVIGSSLKVRPVSLIPNLLPKHVPQVLINREPLKHLNFDVELLGDCDAIVEMLVQRLDGDWSSVYEHPHAYALRDISKIEYPDYEAPIVLEDSDNEHDAAAAGGDNEVPDEMKQKGVPNGAVEQLDKVERVAESNGQSRSAESVELKDELHLVSDNSAAAPSAASGQPLTTVNAPADQLCADAPSVALQQSPTSNGCPCSHLPTVANTCCPSSPTSPNTPHIATNVMLPVSHFLPDQYSFFFIEPHRYVFRNAELFSIKSPDVALQRDSDEDDSSSDENSLSASSGMSPIVISSDSESDQLAGKAGVEVRTDSAASTENDERAQNNQ